MQDNILEMIRQFCKAVATEPPCVFMGLTGSRARKKAGRLSDYDLLVFVDSDLECFWPRLPKIAKFVAELATYICERVKCNLVVTSSLVAEDLMPFVSIDQDFNENIVLHIIIYPTPYHFVRWEAAPVRTGLIEPFCNSGDYQFIGNLEPFRKLIDPRIQTTCELHSADDALAAVDICVQAFIVGIVQAFCHSLYRSDFVSRYSFHLFRYAARYLIRHDDRPEATEEVIAEIPIVLPITAEDPQKARILLRTWLKAWEERNEEPLASQLPTLYKSATVYFHDLHHYLRSKNTLLSPRRKTIIQETTWTDGEKKTLVSIAQAAQGTTYVVSFDRIGSNIDAATQLLDGIIANRANIWFSVKSFPSNDLITGLGTYKTHLSFAIASQRELDIVVQGGIKPTEIMLHAPALDSALEASLSQGKVSIVSVGSTYQYQRLQSVLPSDTSARLLARITPAGLYDSKFGMTLDEFTMLWHSKRSMPFSGIHIHLGDKLYCRESVSATAEVVAKALAFVLQETEKPIVNLGGGWRSQTYENWFQLRGIDNIRYLVEKISSLAKCKLDDLSLHFEFGHRIVEDAVVAACHVLETRKTKRGYTHILDGGEGMLPLLKSTVYGVSSILIAEHLPRLMGELAGPACYEADRFEGAELELAPGDLVVFSNAGAYSLPFASGFGGFFPSIKAMFKQSAGPNREVFDFSNWNLW